MNNKLVEITGLWRSYQRGTETINACAGINLFVKKGEIVSIVGRSGSGKTTLLNQIGCLDSPTKGEVKIGGIDVAKLRDSALVEFRRRMIGFVFQLFYLIPTLSVWENIELPLIFSRRRDKRTIEEILETIGITDIKNKFPGQLDSGSMQKVAIARALVNKPEIILADEPTGRLEAKSKDNIIEIFYQLQRQGLTIIIATHDLVLAEKAQRVIQLSDGLVADERILSKEAK